MLKNTLIIVLTICAIAMQTLIEPAYAQISEFKITASDGAVHDYFGNSISISGDYAVVGTAHDDDRGFESGSAYVFKRAGTSWGEETKLLPSDGAEGDFFGVSVSISGDYAIVGARGDDDNGENSGSAYVYSGIIVGIDDERAGLPTEFTLAQNYPNPFNPETMIRYSIPKAENVSLVIYNLIGEEVAHLIDKLKPAGRYTVTWNASNFASGIYFYRLQAGDFVQTRKMVLLK